MKNIILIILIISSVKAFSFEIAGKVLDERYFPVPNISITVSGGSMSKTGRDGTFRISTDNSPYDLILYDLSGNIGVIYKDLTTSTPELMFFGLSASTKY